jgi:hypothetical protein
VKLIPDIALRSDIAVDVGEWMGLYIWSSEGTKGPFEADD